MIDSETMNFLFGAAEQGRWWQFVGGMLVVLIVFGRYITQGRFNLSVQSWISAATALLSGVAAGLVAGATWWSAIIIGAFVLPTSKGFWDKVRDCLPKAKDASVAMLIVFLLPFVTSCAGYQVPDNACETERTIVEALGAAHGAVGTVLPSVADDDIYTDLGDTVDVGQAFVDGCENLRDRRPWTAWLSSAARVVSGIVSIVMRHRGQEIAGPEGTEVFNGEIPELTRAALLLQEATQ